MKKLLAALLLVAPAPALAGFGVSGRIGSPYFPVSIDIREKGLLVQIHAVDLVEGLVDGNLGLDTGLDITTVAFKKQCGPEVEGVIMPGGGAHVLVEEGSFGFEVVGEARFGAEMKKGTGFGIYIVPQIGVSNYSNAYGEDIGLVTRGQIELSWWIK